MEVIIDAKERQAAEANKNATILLQEIDQEKVGAGISLLAVDFRKKVETNTAFMVSRQLLC